MHADQLRRIAADEHPARFGLLVTAESAGALVAAEMTAAGLPWRPEVHDALLTELLGPRPALPGQRPARLADLAGQITAAFGVPDGRGSRGPRDPRLAVNPDSPTQVLQALAADGIRVPSTRLAVLRDVDHPAIAPLLEYKELARLHSAFGWAWLDTWVRGGRFRPEYVVGGVVSGRWASRGGGALQIPRMLRQAVVADPGWVLVVADAAQLEPRVLAALAGDRAFAAAAGAGDLYAELAVAFGGDRAKAKVAMLSAMYGGAGGEAGQLLAVLRQRFPAAAGYVEAAARAGEEGRVVRSVLGRTCPPPSAGLARAHGGGGRPGHRARPGGRAGLPCPRPVHEELRGPGERGGLGPGDAGQPAGRTGKDFQRQRDIARTAGGQARVRHRRVRPAGPAGPAGPARPAGPAGPPSWCSSSTMR